MSEQMATEVSKDSGEGSKRKRGSDWVRKRVSQACDICRKKKLKCDGLRPTCTTCVSLGKGCMYEDAVKKRGLPEGYVRGLETLLGLLQTDGRGIDDIGNFFDSSIGNEAVRGSLIQKWNGTEGSTGETMPEKWRSSRLCKALESLLPVLDGDGRGQDAKRLRMEPHSVVYSGGITTSPRPNLDFPPREVAEDLFAIYFTHVHSWLPIVGKDEMLASYYRTLELTETSLEPGEHAILWAVIAYSECRKAAITDDDKQAVYWQESPRSCSYYEKAWSLIPREGSHLGIGHIQALMVLALVKLGLGQSKAAWLLVNQAISNGIDLGLTDTTLVTLSGSKSRNKHVLLGCFYLDTLLSTCLGRLPRLRKESALEVGPLDENGLEEWGQLNMGARQLGEQAASSRSISTFNHLIRLTCVLNDFAHERFNSETKTSALQQMQVALNSWKRSLPAYCAFDSGANKGAKVHAPHQLNLYITFSVCNVLCLGRESINAEGALVDIKAVCGATERPHSSSLFASTASPPTFSLIIDLAMNVAYPAEEQWMVSHVSMDANISDPITVPLPSCSLDKTMPRPKTHVDRASSFSKVDIYSANTFNGLKSAVEIAVASSKDTCTDNSSILSHSTIAHPNNIRQSSTNTLDSDIESPKRNLAYQSLFPTTTTTRNQESQLQQQRESNPSTASVEKFFLLPASLSSPANGLTSVAMLDSIDFTDDYFFELSNLDQFTGDQDETYRNLGFLGINDQDSTTQSTTLQVPSSDGADGHTPDEWSHWFGQSTGLEEGLDHI